jgi:hypothetical protein
VGLIPGQIDSCVEIFEGGIGALLRKVQFATVLERLP